MFFQGAFNIKHSLCYNKFTLWVQVWVFLLGFVYLFLITWMLCI